jgi:hypothetical protein
MLGVVLLVSPKPVSKDAKWGVSLPAGTFKDGIVRKVCLGIIPLVFGDISKIDFSHISLRSNTDFGILRFLAFGM